MSRESSATLNYQLTAYAQGHMNDLADTMALINRLAPPCPVPGTTGQYKKFDDKNSFQTYSLARVMGGDPKRMEFSATDGTFNCKPRALEVTVDKEERRQVGEDNAIGQQLLDEGKIRALLGVVALSEVNDVVTAVLAALTPVADRGNWSNAGVDPIDQLDEQLDLLTKVCGSTAFIKLDMDVSSWRTIRNHPKVKARVGGSQATPLTRQQLVDSLVIPVDLMISSISKNTAALGQTVAKSRVQASEVILHYGLPNPTQYDPSAFKRFTVGPGSQIASVRSYAAPNGFYDGHIVDFSEDLQQTSTQAAIRLSIT